MAKASVENTARYRWMVLSRLIAGFIAGYLVASLFAIVLALLLPLISDTSQAEALLIATMWSFVLYAVIVIWAFTTRSALRAWLGLLGGAAFLGAAWFLLRQLTG